MDRAEAISLLKDFMPGRSSLEVKDTHGQPVKLMHDTGYLAIREPGGGWNFLQTASTVTLQLLAEEAARIRAEERRDIPPDQGLDEGAKEKSVADKARAGESFGDFIKRTASKAKDEGPDGGLSRYLDPKQNPFIKIGGSPPLVEEGVVFPVAPSRETAAKAKAEAKSKYLDPKQNPFIKV